MEEKGRIAIVHKYLEDTSQPYCEIAKSLKKSQSTVRKVILRYLDSLSTKRASSKQIHTPKDPALVAKVLRDIKKNPNLSLRKRAQNLETTKSHIARIMKNHGIKTFRKIRTPRRSDKQSTTVKTRQRRLYDQILTKHTGCILMDDETYQYSDLGQTRGPEFYCAEERLGVEDKHKFKELEKFPEKYLIWQAICTCGLKTTPYISKGTMNGDSYLKNCLKRRLLPLIKKHNTPVLFWPDLPSCHFSKSVKEWYEKEGLFVVPKECNPPNTPEIRPIERYWAIVKRKLLDDGTRVTSVEGFRRKWIRYASTMTIEVVQNLMGGVRSKVRRLIKGESLH